MAVKILSSFSRAKLSVNLTRSLCHCSTLVWSILTPVGTLGSSDLCC